MKKILILALCCTFLINFNYINANAEELTPEIEIPTGEDWENIPEMHEWPAQGDVLPLWDYTFSVSLSLTYTDDHANIVLDVDGYETVDYIQAVIIFEKYVDGEYVEQTRYNVASEKSYLYKTAYPSAEYSTTYRVTALIWVYSGMDYDYIALRNTKPFIAANVVSLDDLVQ